MFLGLIWNGNGDSDMNPLKIHHYISFRKKSLAEHIQEVILLQEEDTPRWWWPLAIIVLYISIFSNFAYNYLGMDLGKAIVNINVLFSPLVLFMVHMVMLKVETRHHHQWNSSGFFRLKTGLPFIMLNMALLLASGSHGLHYAVDSGLELISTLAYLGGVVYALYGFGLRIDFKPTAVNLFLLNFVGMLIASFVSTIGASLLLAPSLGAALLRMEYNPRWDNLRGKDPEKREMFIRRIVLLISTLIFIFNVGNYGGALTFRGELPSFLLMQKGVPVLWQPVAFVLVWAITNLPGIILMLVFNFIMRYLYFDSKEDVKFKVHVYDWGQVFTLAVISALDLTYIETLIHADHSLLILIKSTLIFFVMMMSRNMIQRGDGINPLASLEINVDTLYKTSGSFFAVVFLCLGGTLMFFEVYGAEMVSVVSDVYVEVLHMDEQQSFLTAYHQIIGLCSSGVDNAPCALSGFETGKSPHVLELFQEYPLISGVPEPVLEATLDASMRFGLTFVFSNITNVIILMIFLMMKIVIKVSDYVMITLPLLLLFLLTSPFLANYWLSRPIEQSTAEPVVIQVMKCEFGEFEVPNGTIAPDGCSILDEEESGH